MSLGPIYYGDPVNRADPLAMGMLALWKVVPWYASGPRFIDLCGRNHGTLTNGPTWSGQAPRGGFGSLSFDGTDDYVRANVPPSYGVSGLSIFVWVKVTGTLSEWNSVCGDSKGPFSANNPVYFHVRRNDPPNAGGYGVDWRGTTSTANTCSVSATFPTDTWKNYGFTVDSSSIRLFLDGDEVANTSNTRGMLTPGYVSDFYIGCAYYNSLVDFIAEHLDDIRVFDRALSAAEVYALYEDDLRGNPRLIRRMPTRVWSIPTAAGGLSIPIAAYHYSHHLGSMA